MRYNGVAENIYLLERCGELNAERRAWLENVRGHAIRATGWTPAEVAAQDEALQREFRDRYPTIPKERCEPLARATDIERARTLKVP
ncbi:MAG TPA: hypothetical protein VFB93_26210 [Burkholderiales bacterium]|nr:hypothetical protein [Burkholderiales bacterium]